MNRIIWIVIDSVGIGELNDSKEFGDEGVNTLGNIVKEFNDIKIPNMIKLGLGNIDGVNYLNKETNESIFDTSNFKGEIATSYFKYSELKLNFNEVDVIRRASKSVTFFTSGI